MAARIERRRHSRFSCAPESKKSNSLTVHCYSAAVKSRHLPLTDGSRQNCAQKGKPNDPLFHSRKGINNNLLPFPDQERSHLFPKKVGFARLHVKVASVSVSAGGQRTTNFFSPDDYIRLNFRSLYQLWQRHRAVDAQTIRDIRIHLFLLRLIMVNLNSS